VVNLGRRGNTYIYLTAKRLFVGPNCVGNRPGWHTDGFGTDDINYIWCDSLPTEFCVNQHFNLSDDHEASMRQMEDQAKPENIKTYPVGSLLRLDSAVVHRCARPVTEGYRITTCSTTTGRWLSGKQGEITRSERQHDAHLIPQTRERLRPRQAPRPKNANVSRQRVQDPSCRRRPAARRAALDQKREDGEAAQAA
jgi:hypothetical protein